MSQILSLTSPIPRSIQRKSDAGFYLFLNTLSKTTDKRREVVPFYGGNKECSHAMLKLLETYTSRSPSYKISERDIVRYSFGKVTSIDSNLSDVGIRARNVAKLSQTLQKHLFQSGNAFLRIKISIEGGTTLVKLDAVHYRKIAYLWTETTSVKEFIIPESWTIDAARNKNYEIVPASTVENYNWSERLSGRLYETIVHFKTEGNDSSDWYGRPDILSVIESMCSEISLNESSCKVNSTELVAKGILAMEDKPLEERLIGDEGEAGDYKQQVGNVIRQTLTNKEFGIKKDKSGLGLVWYPRDGKTPVFIPFNVNRDSGWYQTQKDDHSGLIFGCMGWSREMAGLQQSKSSLGTDALISRAIITSVNTISPMQDEWVENWGMLIEEIGRMTNRSFNDEIEYADRMSEVINGLKEIRTGRNNEARTFNTDGDN